MPGLTTTSDGFPHGLLHLDFTPSIFLLSHCFGSRASASDGVVFATRASATKHTAITAKDASHCISFIFGISLPFIFYTTSYKKNLNV